MPRYKLTIEYDGSHFFGWQKQSNAISVQETLEEALKIITKEDSHIVGAGRTDSGVHAIGQVAHFDCSQNLDPLKIMNCINNNVGEFLVSITKVEEVPMTFHARKSAVRRHYVYKIINRIAPLAIMKNKALHLRLKLNVKAMIEASQYLIGTKDFSSFRDSRCQSLSPIKTIHSINITQKNDLIEIHFIGSSFLHHQVRNMVGTLLLVGKNAISIPDFIEIINARDRKVAGPTIDPYGLYLFKIYY